MLSQEPIRFVCELTVFQNKVSSNDLEGYYE